MQNTPSSEWVTPALQLLRHARNGALATQSLAWPRTPYASWLMFSSDEAGQPWFCISGLAEHTRNLRTDAHASLLIVEDANTSAAPARVTLVGTAQPATPSPLLEARLLRYQPESAQYLQLGDFAWWQLQLTAVRYIAGFGRMGVGDQTQWQAAPQLALQDEVHLLHDLPALDGAEWVGLDFYGCDVRRQGQLHRYDFKERPHDLAALAAAARQAVTA
ncbi:HugZ family pyridoxamine 5'-phosphate oxidase [Amantichitinum ursilacus]|uniref:Pyridoxamine 5'-phosphate oxidase n=1 Tax=Amantichitinum ursilacus TaxID=857265 RepID=A0A0N0XI18_9NEIS|nr:pyridoxamine 5'-phosphate oxidase family protein [Amantichitinum ursilacus]KPC52247.1 Pyridoxamine 5'-phosphate oxidase [Amantichitinum ursilacus]